MKNDSNVTLNGVFYEPSSNGSEEILNLDKIKAKARIGIRLTKDEEEFLAAAKARETLYGKK